jgi:hypothetical protein
MERLLILMPLYLLSLLACGQNHSLDSVEFQTLNASNKLAKCIFLDKEVSADEKKAHELIWGLKSVRDLANGMLQIGTYMETLTVTLEKPNDKSAYFFIALYNRQPRVINKLMIYRVDLNKNRIEKRYDLDNKWTKVKN